VSLADKEEKQILCFEIHKFIHSLSDKEEMPE